MNPFHYGIQGSKIFVTTRSERVASIVKTVPSFYRLGLLSGKDCLSLFRRHAFYSSDSTSNSYSTKNSSDIISKCKGLPLAAKALGGLFRSKPDIKHWNTILKSDIWNSTKNEIIPSLRVNYHYLPPHLKQCFVYCSIFPKNYEFEKKILILMWMAEGFLQPLNRGITLEEVGYEYFDDLTSRSFFQPSSHIKGKFVMHSLIHDLATSIAGDFGFRSGKDREGDKISSRTRHLSYTVFGYSSLDHLESFKRAKALRTFLGLNSWCIPDSIGNAPDIMQLNLEYLRVLSLEGYRALKIVPNSIGEFIHLRYLDLSDTEIVSLPNSLCKLYNLQTLRLRYCFRLKMMPSDMQDLVNLRHLDIAYTYLKEMPKGLSKLKDLQFLSDFIIGKDHGTMIGELGECSHLQEGIHIANLENVNNSNEAYMAKMMEKKHIKDLRLSWSSEECINDSKTERDILDKLQPHWDLECLHINGDRGTSFPEWLGSFSYQNMTDLYLRDCRSCWMLPPLGQLPALKRLRIYGLDRVVNIGAEFSKGDYYASVVPFASLESLWFKNMFAWKEWHSIEMEAFPKLRELTIYDCPKFTGDLPHQLLSLETLKIKKCPLLASSMPKYPAIQYLQLLRSEKVELQELSLSLQSLTISGCRQMESMFKAMGDFEYSYLEDLQLNECSSAISVPVIYMPPSMKKLRIYNCKLLELPDHQRHMSIESL